MNIRPKITLAAALALAFSTYAAPASAMMLYDVPVDAVVGEPEAPPLVVAQSGGMTLSQAVEQVRRRSDVERVISAETEVRNGREVHVIKVLTRDGRVTTHRIPGRQVN